MKEERNKAELNEKEKKKMKKREKTLEEGNK